MVLPPTFLSLFRIFLAILGFLCFHIKLKIALSKSVSNYVRILMGKAWNLEGAYVRMVIFIILIFPIHEQGRSFHLLLALIFLQSLSPSLTCMVRFTPKYIIWGYLERCYHSPFLISMRRAIHFCQLILYPPSLLKGIFNCRSFPEDFFMISYINYQIICK